MKLVFITRKMHRGDSRTGFVFGWVEKISKNFEKLYVICQEKGDISGLPGNVEVHSFGKEKGYGKLYQGYLLLVTCFKLARRADGFFCHMMPIYAIVAWLPAKLSRKKLVLWYTHKHVDLKLKLATALVDQIFSASKESFRLKTDKLKIVGHGIDVEKFIAHSSELSTKNTKFKIVSVGRISPVKDYETLIKAADALHDQGVKDFVVEIYGSIGLPEHQAYFDSLQQFVRNAELEGVVKFQGELDYEYIDEVYQEADLVVNLSKTGSIDKAVLEAAASGTLVLTSNEAFQEQLGQISANLLFERDNPKDLEKKILKLKSLVESERSALVRKLQKWVNDSHNLETLAIKIAEEFKQN